MDREKLEARLIQAKKRVALGEKHIARQREFVLGLEWLGDNADAARKLCQVNRDRPRKLWTREFKLLQSQRSRQHEHPLETSEVSCG
jgi:hypothetical protein